jgi:hypothetical protein
MLICQAAACGAGSGRVLSNDSSLALWWCSSAHKVRPADEVPLEKGDAIRISAARNEAEAAQLVIYPHEKISILSVRPATLTGPAGAVIPADNVEILRVRYVTTTIATDKTCQLGEWPDPLPPLIQDTISPEPKRNQPLWVRVKVPHDAPAGTYRGKIQLETYGLAWSVPMEVEVYDFNLPEQMTCVTAFGFSPGNVWRYQNIKTEADRRAVLEKYWANFAAHHISPYDPAPLDRIGVRWPNVSPPPSKLVRLFIRATRWTDDGEELGMVWFDDLSLTDPATGAVRARHALPLLQGGNFDSETRTEPVAPAESLKAELDFAAWDKAMARAIDHYKFNSFRVDIPGIGGGTFHELYEPSLLGFGEKDPEYALLFNSYCRQLEEHLVRKGWVDEAYIYWFDEPDPGQYAFVKNGFDKLKRACPQIDRMLTEQPEAPLAGGPNIYCVISDLYHHEAAEARRAAGDKFWWYICTGPKAPYCTLFIDHPGTELRVWLWQTWQRNIEGILVWETNYWTSSAAYPDAARPQNPYEDPMGWTSGYSTPAGQKRPWGNGDGRFIYPPEAAAGANPPQPVLDGPVDSIRWEMLRDGIEDYEYLAMLKRAIAEKRAALAAAQVSEFESLLQVPEGITRGMTEFTTDPAPIETRRNEIARAIEKLARM